MKRFTGCLSAIIIVAGLWGLDARTDQLNVLMIAVDDLRPSLGCYGDPIARTPHMDRIAERGTVFLRAYSQYALCAPSRASLLSGLRPETTGIFDLRTPLRGRVPELVTLPQWFKQNGYHCAPIGKVNHGAIYSNKRDLHYDPESWSAPWWTPPYTRYFTPEGEAATQERFKTDLTGEALWRKVKYCKGLAWESADRPDEDYADGKLATEAVKRIHQYKDRQQPFFLAVGFYRPHLPFVAPKKYFDLYPLETMDTAPNPDLPTFLPGWAYHDFSRPYPNAEMRGYHRGDKSPEALRRAYYACVSFVDAQVGRLLKALDDTGLAENTVIVLWGDHGFHLGDHGLWGKCTNFEKATHAPLIISSPRIPSSTPSPALVEFVDVYPTLAELCGLPPRPHWEGLSAVPLMKAPETPWKHAAFHSFRRFKENIHGLSIRTARYRYTEWTRENKIMLRELYDYQRDALETANFATDPAYANTLDAMKQALALGGEGALPSSSVFPSIPPPITLKEENE